MRHIIPIMSLLIFLPSVSMAQSTTENYVMTETMLDATGETSVKAVQYYNGLGFPTLSVATTGGSGETAYTLTTYDGLGREDRKYVPVPGSNLDYISESSIRSKGYYYQDNSGFTQNHYDALDRVLAVDIAGDKWRLAGKQNRTEHLANTEEDKVLHYEAHTNSNTLAVPSNPNIYYPAGSLTKEISIDADDKKVETYKNLFGDVILQRVNGNMDTYYVYDEIGHLRFVLSPSYQKNGNTAISCYEYRYDDRGRVVWKKLPGAEYVQYWYDDADRVVCAQDAVMRKSENNKFRFTVYDKLGRVAIQGLCSNYTHRAGLATVTYKEGASGFLGTGYEIPSSLSSALKNPELEIVNYYDNHNFLGKNPNSFFTGMSVTPQVSQTGQLTGSAIRAGNGEFLSQVMVYDLRGNLLETKSREIGGRIVSHSSEYSFTNKVESSSYHVNFGNENPLMLYETMGYNEYIDKMSSYGLSVGYGKTGKSFQPLRYEYDELGRLSKIERPFSLKSNSDIEYKYDLHGWTKEINSGSFKEELFYADGYGSPCYNGNISSIKWESSDYSQIRGYKFTYDDANRLTQALYGEDESLDKNTNRYNEKLWYDVNGNITALERRGMKDNGTYDVIDNLSLSYNGNQLSNVIELATIQKRAGSFDIKDEGRIISPKDPIYVGGPTFLGNSCKYNENGSLLYDMNRKIVYISYDLNNNPKQIYFANGNITKYVYSATGQKLRVVYYTAVPNIKWKYGERPDMLSKEQILYADSTDYLMGGSLILKNGVIDKYLFAGGYCQWSILGSSTGSIFNTNVSHLYYYNQDHLGNIREVVNDGGVVQQVTNYYPFGTPYSESCSDFQPYKYNGKELDKMHGLNTYDYGARQYNPVIPVWDRIDPLAEKNYPYSPYSYCAGDPVNKTDPDGRDDYKLNEDGYLEFWRKTNAKTTDRIYTLDKKDNITINKRITTQLMTDREDYNGNYAVGGAELQDIFKFCSDHSNVEWRLTGYKTSSGEKNVLMTSHKEDGVSAQNDFGDIKETNLNYIVHSHPSELYPNPSGYGKGDSRLYADGTLYMFPGDKSNAYKISQKFEKQGRRAPKFYMYHPSSQTLVRYNKDKILTRKEIKDGRLHL